MKYRLFKYFRRKKFDGMIVKIDNQGRPSIDMSMPHNAALFIKQAPRFKEVKLNKD